MSNTGYLSLQANIICLLHKVYTEIEGRFLRQDNGQGAMTGAPQRKGINASR
jgi:hypothetical protein